MCCFDFKGVIRCPANMVEGGAYELPLILVEDVEKNVSHHQLRLMSGLLGHQLSLKPNLRLQARGLTGSYISGYVCPGGEELLFGAWVFAQTVHDVLKFEVDLAYSDTVLPLLAPRSTQTVKHHH